MADPSKTNRKLIEENALLKQRIQELEKSEPERKRVEDELQLALRRFQIILSNLYGGILVVSNDNRVEYANQAFCDLFDLDNLPKDLLGLSAPEIIQKINNHYANPADALARIQELIAEKQPIKDEEVAIMGNRTYIRDYIPIVINEKHYGRLWYHYDITKRKQTEEALTHSHGLMRFIIEHNRSAIAVHDRDLKYVYVSQRYLQDYGVKEKDVIGKHHYDVFPDLPQKWRDVHQKALSGEVSSAEDDPYVREDGSVDWTRWECRPWYEADGSIGGIIVYTEVITERKRAEAKLKQQTDAMDAAIDGIALLNDEGEYVYLNEAHVKVYGYENAEELIGKSWRILYDSDVLQRFDQEIMPEFSQKGDWHGEAIGTKKNRSKFPQELSLTAMANGGLICVIRDITNRKQAEKKLQDALESLRKSFSATVQVLVSAVETRDPYTSGHQIRSADLARAIATELELPQKAIEGLHMASTIHDIGKLSVPVEILSKPTKLSELEFFLIKEHVQKGYEMLKDVESPWPLAEIVHQHHERIDGSGYPRNLKGEEILIEARILAVADVVESMASHRPYRPALGLNVALAEIENNKGILYDADAVDACLRLFRGKGFQFEETRL